MSVWLFYLANWVGQDYFSPQSLNYFFHLIIIGICLRWFGIKTPPTEVTQPAVLEIEHDERLAREIDAHKDAIAVRLVDRHSRMGLWKRALSQFYLRTGHVEEDAPDSRALALQRVGLMSVVILLFVVVATSHQLTPFMTIVAVTALVVCRLCSSYRLPVLMVVIAVSWIIFGAREFFTSEIDGLIAAFGRVSDSFSDNLIDFSHVPWGQKMVALAGRGVCVAVSVMALLGGIRRLRLGYLDLPGILLAVVAVAPLVATTYGGEVLFRVYFFALPAMIFFVAALTYPSPDSSASGRTAILPIALSIMLFVGFSFAHYGKDRQYHFTEDEVDVAQYLYSSAPPGALLIEGSRSYPTQFKNYEFFTYVPISREPHEGQLRIHDNPVEVLTRWMSNRTYPRAYLIITRSQKADVDASGRMPGGFLDSIERALLESPRFQVAYGNEDARVFVLADDANRDEP
jgi:hypothetical protein